MELFSLLAKLTLDTTEYDRGVSRLQGQEIDGGDVSVGLDHRDYDAGVEDVSQGSDSLGEHVGSIFEGIKSAIVAAGITAVLTQITSVIKECVDKAATMGDEIDKGSKRLGISTRTYQVWNHALQQSGGSINDVARGMMNFRSVMNDSTEVTEAEAKALAELGIDVAGKTREELRGLARDAIAASNSTKDHTKSIETLNSLLGDNEEEASGAAGALKELGIDPKKYATAEELMKDTLLTLADIEDIDTRDRLAEALFGRNSGGIKAMLYEGREGVKALLEEADDLGLVMSDEEIQNAVAYGDALANLNAELDAIKTAFVDDIMPLLTDGVKQVTKILAFFNPRLWDNSLSDILGEQDDAFNRELVTIEATSDAAMNMVDKLYAMGDAEKLTAEQQAEWRTNAEWLIQNIPSLSGVIDLDTMSINANRDAIKDTILQWELLAKERALANVKEAKYQAIVEREEDAIDARTKARQKENDAAVKYREAIAFANQAIAENKQLSEWFLEKYGTTTITGNEENLDDMLTTVTSAAGYWGVNKKDVNEALGEYHQLTQEAEQLRAKADKYDQEVADAKKDFEDWSAAADELFLDMSSRTQAATEEVNKFHRALLKLPDDVSVSIGVNGSGLRMFKQAKGNWDVPYDNYPSLLHRNEMVLTASEARRYREGDTGVDLTGLRSEIVAAIREGMADATVNSYLDGQAVTDTVSRRLAAEVAGRRFG